MSGLFNNEYPYTDFHELNLSWVIKKVKELLDHMREIDTWKEDYQQSVDDLQQFYDDLIAGKYPPEFIQHLEQWISQHGVDIIMKLIKMVFFGLNDDGYFVAYIPQNWEEITFKTTGWDIDISNVDYGHLVLLY